MKICIAHLLLYGKNGILAVVRKKWKWYENKIVFWKDHFYRRILKNI